MRIGKAWRGMGGGTNVQTIRAIVRRDLVVIFLVALLAGGGGFYLLLEHAALDTAGEEAQTILETAMAIRGYTTDRILPRLRNVHDNVFHEETVPSFAAQTVFRSVAARHSAFSYSESALNPTVPGDRAEPFEVGLIRLFRSSPTLAERRGVLDRNGERLFYLARPIRITDAACLVCHDTAARAPRALLAKYGSENGFGWKLHEIVGVQLVTVPVTRQFRGTLRLVLILSGGLTVIFAVAFFALTAAMDSAVVAPLARLARAADLASRWEAIEPPLPLSGAREIRLLAEAIQRLRESLTKALRHLGGSHDG